MAQTHTCIMRPITIAEGITRHAMRVDTSQTPRVNKPSYEAITTIDGAETITKIRTDASMTLWIEQARQDAAEYAADLDMQDANRRAAAKMLKMQRRVARPVQLALAF